MCFCVFFIGLLIMCAHNTWFIKRDSTDIFDFIQIEWMVFKIICQCKYAHQNRLWSHSWCLCLQSIRPPCHPQIVLRQAGTGTSKVPWNPWMRRCLRSDQFRVTATGSNSILPWFHILSCSRYLPIVSYLVSRKYSCPALFGSIVTSSTIFMFHISIPCTA